MTELLVSAIIGGLFFLVFLAFAFRGQPSAIAESKTLHSFLKMVELPGLSFSHVNKLLDSSDYTLLRSRPDMHGIARELQRERREITLAWLKSLQIDLLTLWRFRRFIVQRGVPVTLSEEVRIAATAMSSHALLLCLRFVVFFVGPFALRGSFAATLGLVRRVASLCASLLQKIPTAGWPEVDREWSRSVT